MEKNCVCNLDNSTEEPVLWTEQIEEEVRRLEGERDLVQNYKMSRWSATGGLCDRARREGGRHICLRE